MPPRLGRIERSILDALGEVPPPGQLPLRVLIARLYGAAPTPAQLASYRRALGSLRRKGLVAVRSSWMWRGRRVQLAEPRDRAA
jgi:hypothetical protein